MPGVLIMPKLLNKSCEYGRVLNMQVLHSILNIARICLDRVLNIFWVVNMPGFWMWQGCEYARVTQGSKYVKLWLNMSE